VAGTFGAAQVPNFGGFEYSPFVRPADDELGHLRAADATTRAGLLAALAPWQKISLTNPTDAPIHVTQLTKGFDHAILVADQFVTVTDSNLNVVTFPLTIGAGATIELFAFYDPAIRAADNTVLEQYPEWFNDPATPGVNESQTRPSHTFGQDDSLLFATDAGFSYFVFLVGGSTYDSDIFFTGSVNLADLGQLDDFLTVQWPTRAGDPGFEPTSDINARFPNGADGTLDSGAWPLVGDPLREYGLGDFAPLNVEFGRVRANPSQR
jgi:hypothetical protein